VFKIHFRPTRIGLTPRFLGKINPKRHKLFELLKKLLEMPIGQPGLELTSAKRERENTRRTLASENTLVLNRKAHRPFREAITILAGRPQRKPRSWAVSGILAVGNENQASSWFLCEVVIPPWTVFLSCGAGRGPAMKVDATSMANADFIDEDKARVSSRRKDRARLLPCHARWRKPDGQATGCL